jgi:hypothetical protein
MKAKVEICYEDKAKNQTIEIPLKGSPKGLRLMNAVEKAVEKTMKDDANWTRWNLLDVIE